MRGKASVTMLILCSSRITPAYAGKSAPTSLRFVKSKDHPRLCGEKVENPMGFMTRLWITPAYAGKSIAEVHAAGKGRDHPRLCGEKPVSTKALLRRWRITPAYAGKSTTT